MMYAKASLGIKIWSWGRRRKKIIHKLFKLYYSHQYETEIYMHSAIMNVYYSAT